ncbi:hypothetical protein [Marivita hallyeonensis]|uniref:Uncharacterized protein n=1 Tax=Marivita hallyeonensis TaxID=996342 RepID=A0A1M5S2D4_9RHOB|nr:hypothetical protein [Marivita hallyeonensis]SHH32610.1 hypothetical protein SAMN05443551_1978 [Marivita hallyeonensis]
MRIVLLIFALVASPAFAIGDLPDKPTVEKPNIEKPEKPTTPKTPEPPEKTDEEPNRPNPKVVVTKPKPKHPGLRCFDDNGVRKVSFTKNVDPEFYKMGRKFCAKVPYEIEEVSVHCVQNNGTYQVQMSKKLPHKAVYKAKRFCICVFGLD